jgi:hypothetical protein
MEMTSSQELTIPKSRRDVIILFVITTVGILSTSLAVVNIFNRVAIIASVIWLALVTTILWTPAKRAGGLRRFLTNCLGELFGRNFVEAVSLDAPAKEIRFGYELFGHRFIQHSVAIDKIESIEWKTGQATDMAGRDMKDWSVCLWFDHGDPVKSEKKRKWRKPDQDISIVGPARRKEITEAFGLSFVTFLRAAGAQLSPGGKSSCFVRSKTETK